ncbi:MAG TPA: hypothetical protein PK129_06730 [Cellvibrionaceae bacterium]|nr:hypothetical protein [Cellvibrionaceae bacterium]
MLEQFKTINDLSETIKELEGMVLRPTPKWSHPTLYRRRDVSESEALIQGVRVKDWFMSPDEQWVLPHDQMGLSFSSTYQNLKDVYKLKQRHNKNRQIDIYWILKEADIPTKLSFIADIDKKGHHFLAATEKMHISSLVIKLKIVARRMSVIRNGEKIL